MRSLLSSAGLVIKQQKEWGEILTGFEAQNKYMVSDLSGSKLYLVAEESGSTIQRWVLKARRPFTMIVLSAEGERVLQIVRPFRFYFHQVKIFDSQGNLLGLIERRFSPLRNIYAVRDSSGQALFQLFGPLLRPWTFKIRNNEGEYGQISKKWSGLFKESFTNADNFGVTFPAEWDVTLKALFLGATFLIDFVHFEDRGKD